MTDSTTAVIRRRALAVKAYGLTDPGRVRASNEDQFLVAELSKAMRVLHTSLPERNVQLGEERGHLFLVADGMGGHLAGERASALAVVAIQEFALNALKWFSASSGPEAQRVLGQFQHALGQADAMIIEEAAEHPEFTGMGTTLTVAYHLDAHLCVVHAGDSRAYIYRDGELHQLTRDHTLIADLVQRGALRPDQAVGHSLRHVVTNVVGGAEGVDADAHALDVAPGDRLLLCSDGLTEMVTNDAILETLKDETDPQAACVRLVALANDAGGRDNITVVIARFDETPEVSASPGSTTVIANSTAFHSAQ